MTNRALTASIFALTLGRRRPGGGPDAAAPSPGPSGPQPRVRPGAHRTTRPAQRQRAGLPRPAERLQHPAGPVAGDAPVPAGRRRDHPARPVAAHQARIHVGLPGADGVPRAASRSDPEPRVLLRHLSVPRAHEPRGCHRDDAGHPGRHGRRRRAHLDPQRVRLARQDARGPSALAAHVQGAGGDAREAGRSPHDQRGSAGLRPVAGRQPVPRVGPDCRSTPTRAPPPPSVVSSGRCRPASS